MFFRWLSRASLLTVVMFSSTVMAGPKVVVSIAPLQSLVAAVTQGVSEVEVLIPAGQSPHFFTLRPSDRRKISEADLLVWVGPGLEQGIVQSLSHVPESRLVTLEQVEGIQWLPARVGGNFEKRRRHGHDDGHHGHDHPDHGQSHRLDERDPHIWLSPANARVIVKSVADSLSAVDPANAQRYRRNADETLARLETLETTLQARLEPVRDRPFIVFHDAFQYFEHAFGLTAVGSVALGPEHTPSVRRVAELRDRIEQLGAICVFREPQFPPRLIETLVEGTSARSGVLDPLGFRSRWHPGCLFPAS